MLWDGWLGSRSARCTLFLTLCACGNEGVRIADGGDGGDSGTGGTGALGGTGAMGGVSGNAGSSAANGGTAASSATGGVGATGGTGATSGDGGVGATSGQGGASGAGAVPPGGDGGMGGMTVCQDLTVTPTPQVPSVMILVDNSSSMYEPRDQLWDALYTALMDPTMGAVKPLEAKVRFGFASYRGAPNSQLPESDNACAEIETVGSVTPATVAPALNNHMAIDTVYQLLSAQGRNPNNSAWETPTGHAVNRIAATLTAFNPDPPGPKIILLVTDGNPNTCRVPNPQCGQDLSIKAVQDAFTAGIGTIPLGIGDIVTSNAGCTTTSMRCGTDHLLDILNAGSGQAVEPPPSGYWYEQCAAQETGTSPGMPRATYAEPGMGATTATPLTAQNPTEIQTRLTELLTDVVSCTIDLDARISSSADPSLARITLGTAMVPYNMPDGWVLSDTRDSITLQGAACTTFREGAAVNVVFPCSNGRPIGM